tara:strand:+ start:3183 stop:3431 length:249 start_codon:yes stop_codon:yes gene_type:complete
MNFTESQWIRGTYSQYTDPTECTEFVVLCNRCQGELEEYEMNNEMGECNECIEEQEEEGSYMEEDDWREDLKAEKYLETKNK